MQILGITGTFGAGKGAVVEYLQTKGFAHFSASGFITEEILRRSMPVNRDSMTIVGNSLRAEHSPSYVVEELFKRAVSGGRNSIIESIRTVGEGLRIKEGLPGTPGFLIAVDADIHVRYERIQLRASEKDHVSFETFEEKEKGEMNSTDPTKHNIAGVIALADFTIQNSGMLEELHEQVDEILRKISR